MTPLVGLRLGGATLTDRWLLPVGEGKIGQPVWWNATALLRDLELRLGLPVTDVDDAVRAQRWSQRIHSLANPAHFYSASYEIDPIGTATELLGWRDELVGAGWNGERVQGGGARLDALHESESMTEPVLPAGTVDRLRCVEQELQSTGLRPYEAIDLAEAHKLWPARWQRVRLAAGPQRHDAACGRARVRGCSRGHRSRGGSSKCSWVPGRRPALSRATDP